MKGIIVLLVLLMATVCYADSGDRSAEWVLNRVYDSSNTALQATISGTAELSDLTVTGDTQLDGGLGVSGDSTFYEDLHIIRDGEKMDIGRNGDGWWLSNDASALYVGGGLGNVNINPSSSMNFMRAGTSRVTWAFSDSADEWRCGVSSSAGRNFILCDINRTNDNFDTSPNNDPTMYFFSSTDPDTRNYEFVAISYDATGMTGRIGVGEGKGLSFDCSVVMNNMKTGTSQADAGAVPGELWSKTDAANAVFLGT